MKKKTSIIFDFWTTIKGNHIKNIKGGLYDYMWWSLLKIIALYIVIVVPLLLIAKHFIDFDSILSNLTARLSDGYVLLIFFISESILGMIPPDIFMIWATKFDSPLLILMILGILSYIGGAVSYQIGFGLSKIPKINVFIENKLERYIQLTRKWGGAFIIIAALFPFSPFSMVVIAVGLLKYPFKSYLLFGISRIVRFVFQGFLYSGLFHLDSLFPFLS